MPTRPQPPPRRSPNARRHLTAVPSPHDKPTRKETYAEEQARLDAEALDRWAAIVADLPPLTDDQITSLAVILNRIDKRRRAAQDTEQKRAA
ncbi:hypothetical protein [Amycolatopsis sp. EV170708-02-1]|uniref:hypothetical protein n=1 Tax=Amycolatopsis sp. EV170708-02-1 TaxID=2919322 RepID=UPI001F0BCF76|nr:hypothetical protein [Amycolatopsis sp. EV170708-02-1]UMP04218.1 hypothetical protein MJQ72_05000 [Amycolatopsis sp. EV170708-02-1]